MAEVIVSALDCQVTYAIIAGGTHSGDLVGPKSSHENFPTCACPINMMGEFVYFYVHI